MNIKYTFMILSTNIGVNVAKCQKCPSAWICINILSEGEVSLLYKKTEKSEEKIFRWGDYRADLGLQRGCGGLNSKYITLPVGLYSINYQNK